MCNTVIISVFQIVLLLATVRNGATQDTQEYILVANGADSDETRIQVSMSNCTNLSLEFAGSVSWTNTRGHCARFWSDYNCTGDSIEVLPRSPSHHDLRPWKFNNKAHSVGPCRDSCDHGVTGHQPDVPFPVMISKETDSMFLSNHRSDILKLNVSGCTPVPSHFQKQTAAVETNGHCLQLWSNANCGIFSSDDDTVELRSDTPLHGNIKYGWWIQTVKAVSHCRHKCNDTKEVTTEYYEPTTVTSSSIPPTSLNSVNYSHNGSHAHLETTPSTTDISPKTISPPTSIRPSTTEITTTMKSPPTTVDFKSLNEAHDKQMKSISEDSGSGWIWVVVSCLALAFVGLGYLTYYRKFQFLRKSSISGMRMRLHDNFEC